MIDAAVALAQSCPPHQGLNVADARLQVRTDEARFRPRSRSNLSHARRSLGIGRSASLVTDQTGASKASNRLASGCCPLSWMGSPTSCRVMDGSSPRTEAISASRTTVRSPIWPASIRHSCACDTPSSRAICAWLTLNVDRRDRSSLSILAIRSRPRRRPRWSLDSRVVIASSVAGANYRRLCRGLSLAIRRTYISSAGAHALPTTRALSGLGWPFQARIHSPDV